MQIGWKSVWQNLPAQPLFYLIFLTLYLLLPITEIFIYRIYWKFNSWKSIPAFIKKKIFNTDILGYSGEAYFYLWANKHINQKNIDIAKAIRDNNIISSVASNLITLVILGIYLKISKANFADFLNGHNVRYIILIFVVIIILVPLAIRFKSYIFSTPIKTALLIFGIHLVRLVIGQILQILQWSVALPAVPLATWISYATVSVVLTRIPFPSNKNLVFMGIAVEMASHYGIHEAVMFGLLGILVAIEKVLNLSLFFILSFLENGKISTSVTFSDLETQPPQNE